MAPESNSFDEYYKIRGGRPLWVMPAAVVLIVGLGIGSLWYFQAYPPGDVELSESEAALEEFTVAPEEKAVMNEAEEYIVPIHIEWEVFEEASYPERADMTAEEIRGLLGTCGYECTVTSIMKLGTYPATGCETDQCSGMATGEGSALTIYAYPNPGLLSIDDFLDQALAKSPVESGMFFAQAEDGSEVREEVLVFEDGTELETHYLAKDDRVYQLTMDISVSDTSDYDQAFYAARRAIGRFILQ